MAIVNTLDHAALDALRLASNGAILSGIRTVFNGVDQYRTRPG